jgi:hypothetical protein
VSDNLVCPYLIHERFCDCIKILCAHYDDKNKQCATLSQLQTQREIADSLAKLVDKQECKAPVEVELQPVKKLCIYCKHELLDSFEHPCNICKNPQKDQWIPK